MTEWRNHARWTSCGRRWRRSEPSCTGFVITFDPDALERRRQELEQQTMAPGFWDDQKRAAQSRPSWRAPSASWTPTTGWSPTPASWTACSRWRPTTRVASRSSTARWTGCPARSPGCRRRRSSPGSTTPARRWSACTPAPAAPTAQDWAEMLLRMYLRWAEHRGLQTELLEATPGEEAGLKSATFTLTGENAYGLHAGREGRAPAGPAVAVRLRPPPAHQLRPGGGLAAGRRRRRRRDRRGRPAHRHLPLTGRGRPARQQDRLGGAHHPPPTGIVVQCQNERSQLQNKAQAMRILSRAWSSASRSCGGQALAKERGEAQDISFGSQIRSYMLHPYTMVRDDRTELKIGNAQGVLDGDLDELIHAYLLQRAATGSTSPTAAGTGFTIAQDLPTMVTPGSCSRSPRSRTMAALVLGSLIRMVERIRAPCGLRPCPDRRSCDVHARGSASAHPDRRDPVDDAPCGRRSTRPAGTSARPRRR